MILKHAFIPVHNHRLQNLCGAADEHIKVIERELNVRISHKHEQFRIEGVKAQAQHALEILQALYEMASRTISLAEIYLMLMDDDVSFDEGSMTLSTRKWDIKTKNAAQERYLANMVEHDITFGIGPAGTGKTYLAVAAAIDALKRSSVQRIILTRPAVEAGERLGYLPGDLAQKIDPYLRPLYDAMHDLMGFDQVQRAFERQVLEVAPLAFMRGRTLNNAFVILDEAQNTTPEQMKMFLTRVGFGSKAVITGDITQIDLSKQQTSGLVDAERILRHVQGISFNYFSNQDVVRHPLIARIADAYDNAKFDSDLRGKYGEN